MLSLLAYERSASHPAAPLIAEVWCEAEQELRRSNAFSFDDLLVEAVRLLAEHPDRLASYRERWKWVVVDEFQDTNEAQGVLVALLAGPEGNVCAVADDDQLIYSWRGAEPRNVLEFGERFPGHGRVCTSAPRSVKRSPTGHCWSIRPTHRRSDGRCRRRDAAWEVQRSLRSSRWRGSATTAT